MSDLQRHVGVLFDQEDGGAVTVFSSATMRKISATMSGARPREGSSMSSTRGPRHQRARATRQHLLLGRPKAFRQAVRAARAAEGKRWYMRSTSIAVSVLSLR